jgi:hypothetical protein
MPFFSLLFTEVPRSGLLGSLRVMNSAKVPSR